MSREVYKKINTPSKPPTFFRLLEPDLFGKFPLHELSQCYSQPCEFSAYTVSCSRNCQRSTVHCMNNILSLVPSSHLMRQSEQLVTIHPFPITHDFVPLRQSSTSIFSQLKPQHTSLFLRHRCTHCSYPHQPSLNSFPVLLHSGQGKTPLLLQNTGISWLYQALQCCFILFSVLFLYVHISFFQRLLRL